MTNPKISIPHSMGMRKTASSGESSTCGTCAFKKPSTPIFCIPEPTTTRKVTAAITAVTAIDPVGDPSPGIIPKRLSVKMKKNSVSK